MAQCCRNLRTLLKLTWFSIKRVPERGLNKTFHKYWRLFDSVYSIAQGIRPVPAALPLQRERSSGGRLHTVHEHVTLQRVAAATVLVLIEPSSVYILQSQTAPLRVRKKFRRFRLIERLQVLQQRHRSDGFSFYRWLASSNQTSPKQTKACFFVALLLCYFKAYSNKTA